MKTREKFHREQKDLTGDEFVSGFARNDKLQPFITLVLYYGTKEWDAPKCLKDMLDLSEFPQEWLRWYRITLNLLRSENILIWSGFRRISGMCSAFAECGR